MSIYIAMGIHIKLYKFCFPVFLQTQSSFLNFMLQREGTILGQLRDITPYHGWYFFLPCSRLYPYSTWESLMQSTFCAGISFFTLLFESAQLSHFLANERNNDRAFLFLLPWNWNRLEGWAWILAIHRNKNMTFH